MDHMERTTPIMIEYSPVFKDAGVSGADETGSWNISGHEVEYSHLDRQGSEEAEPDNIPIDIADIAVDYILDY